MTTHDDRSAGRTADPSDPPARRRWSRRGFLAATPAALAATAVGVAATAVGVAGGALAPGSTAGAGTTTTNPPGTTTAGTTAGATPTPGVYVPPGWGQFIGPKLAAAAAGTGRATVALVGDSICRGFYSSNLDTKGWGGLVAAGLQATYGDGGSGFKSTADSTVWMSGVSGLSSPSTQAFYQAAGNLFTTTGSWTAVTANHLGPGGVALRTTVPTDTLSATVRGGTVKVIWLDGGTEAMGSFSYSIDGGPAILVRPSGVYQIAVSATSGLAAGPHTVTVTASGASATTQTVIIGVAGENETGCLVNQFSRYGQTSAAVNNSDALYSGTWNGGCRYPADLVIYALGANDAHGGLPGDSWARALRTWAQGACDTTYGGHSLGGIDGIVLLPHIGSYDASQWVYQDYAIRARGIAEAYGWALIDAWTAGRNSWSWWHSQPEGSYWADASAPGTSGADQIHPSDLGHNAVSALVLAALSATGLAIH